jgi:hypothetical protein
MKNIAQVVALVLSACALTGASIGCLGNEAQPEARATEAVKVDPAMIVGRYHFVYTDARRAAVEESIKKEAASPDEATKAIAEAEQEADASFIEFGSDGRFHSLVNGKEILTAPYAASPASGATLVLTMKGPGGEEKRTTVRFSDADTIVIDDPRKGELTFRRVRSQG